MSHDSNESGSRTRSSSSAAVQRRAHASSSSQARIDCPCWSSVGGAPWSRRVVSSPSPPAKNRSGGPGSCRPPRVGCSTSTSRPWLSAWSHCVDLVEAAHLAGRDAGRGQLGEQRLGVAVGERPLDQLDDPVPVADPLPVRGQPLGVGVEPERGAELAPQALAADRDLHRAVAAVEQAVRRDAGVVVALRAADLARHRPPRSLEGVHPDDRGEQRRTHDRADAGAVPLVERGDHAVGAVHPGQQVRDRGADPLRVVGPGAGQRHQAGLALGDLVVAGPAALRSVVAEAGDREHHQARVAGLERLDAEAEPVEHAGAEVLHQHVGPVDQPEQDVLVGRVLEVEGDRLLVAVAGEEVGRLDRLGVAHEGRTPAAGVVPGAGRLDLDHPGAEVTEHHPGVRPGEGAGEVDDEDVLEGSAPLVIPVTSPAPRGRPRRAAVRPRSRSPRRSGSACSTSAR